MTLQSGLDPPNRRSEPAPRRRPASVGSYPMSRPKTEIPSHPPMRSPGNGRRMSTRGRGCQTVTATGPLTAVHACSSSPGLGERD